MLVTISKPPPPFISLVVNPLGVILAFLPAALANMSSPRPFNSLGKAPFLSKNVKKSVNAEASAFIVSEAIFINAFSLSSVSLESVSLLIFLINETNCFALDSLVGAATFKSRYCFDINVFNKSKFKICLFLELVLKEVFLFITSISASISSKNFKARSSLNKSVASSFDLDSGISSFNFSFKLLIDFCISVLSLPREITSCSFCSYFLELFLI